MWISRLEKYHMTRFSDPSNQLSQLIGVFKLLLLSLAIPVHPKRNLFPFLLRCLSSYSYSSPCSISLFLALLLQPLSWPTLLRRFTNSPSPPPSVSPLSKLPSMMSKVVLVLSSSIVWVESRRRSWMRAPISSFLGCKSPSSMMSAPSPGISPPRPAARICKWLAWRWEYYIDPRLRGYPRSIK